MEALKIISVCNDRSKAFQLERSLQINQYDYEIIQTRWHGFGTKLNQTYDYLMQNPDIAHFVFLDAYDTCAFGKPSELELYLQNTDSLISTEVNCWPDADRFNQYPESKAKFKYANSGSYYMKSELFKSLMENTYVGNDEDDQRVMTNWVLNHKLKLDYEQDVFLTLCGTTLNKDYEISGNRLLTKQFTMPTFAHGNGKADMNHIYNLL